ncbi:zinc metallochaperone AztD [Rhodococcus sp. IEGM 1408]|uniref:zinc metallochaperone AztD n=1 Tax=Rhodococcus sp. IEGM 1408 TaxID=3082220 RepID=UPI002953243D|nr:zinc metallochaperone AztD [Rhodococcus sp. IEGM 1408]MDV8001741.1 zinc metallochaperone AztD [Rhodococcus sp. IEGM 1408]
MPTDPILRRLRGAAALTLTATVLTACGPDATPAQPAAPTDDATHRGHAAADAATPTEQRRPVPRLVTTYDGGLLVLDAESLEQVADIPLDGYNRLNPVGDDRHLAVSTTGGFQILDVGTWGDEHGDHAHHYTAPPTLTGGALDAEIPGHVVVHDGRTAFFDDGTGRITVVDSRKASAPDADARVLDSAHAHHGVAVGGDDGHVVSTLGDTDSRTGLLVRDSVGAEVTRTDKCPGVHGEAAARDALVFGCEDGAVVYSGGRFSKLEAPDAYGRIGNQAGSPVSAVVLGDYKTDENAELERPERVSLMDTEELTLRLVDLPASYSFRSLGRGPQGEALVLGTDGRLHVIDPDAGDLVRSIDVIDPWTEPVEWKDPRPTLYVRGGTAYITEPVARRVLSVDLATGAIVADATLPHAPDELTGVGGDSPGGHS